MRQIDVLGTGHVTFPPVKVTADNSLTQLYFLHLCQTE